MTTPAFVGRDREVAALTHALAQAPAVVLIEGEAGIGKSRLLQEWTAEVPDRRRRALTAVCPALRESLTLGPIVDAFLGTRERVGDLGLTDLAGALRPLFPEWAADLPPALEPLDDARTARHRLFRALAELLRALHVDLLVVEDAHWADEVTLEFLLFLTSRPQSGAPNLVVTYRPEEVDDQSLLLRLSSRVPAGVTLLRMALPPLDHSQTAALVSSMLDGKPMSAEFSSFLHERTDGVPLAVEESVRLLCDRADLVFREGQWVRLSLSELQVPPTVRDATRERVGRLSAAAQRALQALATLGEASTEVTLAATADMDLEECRSGVAEASEAGMAVGDDLGRWRFRHMLTAAAVYETIPRTDRRFLHLRAGQALEILDPPPVAQLARHFREAREIEPWTRYAELAAHRSLASGDHTTAVVVLDDLLSTAQLPAADTARIARTAAVAALGRKDSVDEVHRHMVRTLREVLDSANLTARQQAEIRNPLGRLLINLGEPQAALTELERAVADLDHDPVEAAKAMTFLGWAYAGPWPAATHLHWLERAAELAPEIDLAPDRLSLAGNRAAALLMLGQEDAWELVSGLPTQGTTSAERFDVARINANIGTGALVWGRYPEAQHHLTVALQLAETEQASRLRYNVLLELANLDWFSGRWEALAERATAIAEAEPDRPTVYLASVRLTARLAAAAGRRRIAEEQFQLVLAEATRLGAVDDTMEAAAALARLWLADGHTDRALRITRQPVETVQTKGVWVWATDLAPARVAAHVAAGQVEEATELTDRFARGLRGRHAPGPQAALEACLAQLATATGDHEKSATGWERTAEAWEGLPRPYDALLARERQAEALIAAGRAEGQALLAEIYEPLFLLGARGDAARVAQRLRDRGADTPRPWRGGRRGYGDDLSPRELDVVRWVVAGKTNREIARILTKSPATVDQQLRSAMRKLKVTSRTALAVAAVEAGVLAEESGQAGES